MTARVWPADAVTGAPSYTGKALRQLVGAIWGGKTTTRPFGARSGVLAGTSTGIVTVSMPTATITPFAGVIDTEASNIEGVYNFAFDANVTKTVTSADPTNQRVDSLSVQLSDPAAGDGSSAPLIDIIYTAGTPGTAGGSRGAPGGPPNIPARSFELAWITVPASGGGAPTVTFKAPFVTALGGIVPAASSADYPANPHEGDYVDDASLDALVRYTGGAWVPVAQSNKPLFQGYQTTAQSIANNTWTPLTIDTESVDTHSGHDTVTNPSYYTVPRPGWYRVTASVRFANNATGTRGIGIGINNQTTPTPAYLQKVGSPGAAAAYDVDITEVVSISSGNIVVMAFQNSGGALLTVGSVPRFSVEFVRPL